MKQRFKGHLVRVFFACIGIVIPLSPFLHFHQRSHRALTDQWLPNGDLHFLLKRAFQIQPLLVQNTRIADSTFSFVARARPRIEQYHNQCAVGTDSVSATTARSADRPYPQQCLPQPQVQPHALSPLGSSCRRQNRHHRGGVLRRDLAPTARVNRCDSDAETGVELYKRLTRKRMDGAV
jgi:hypothetical protein